LQIVIPGRLYSHMPLRQMDAQVCSLVFMHTDSLRHPPFLSLQIRSCRFLTRKNECAFWVIRAKLLYMAHLA
jgi:hypothetical protein